MTEAYLESCQTSILMFFRKQLKSLIIFTKSLILDVSVGSEYRSA